MKTLLKLLVVAVVINAAYRFGMAEYRFSTLKETTRSVLALGTQSPTEHLKEEILKRAGDLALPVLPDNIEVRRDGLRTTANVSYHQEIEAFPGYKYPRDYRLSEEIVALK